MRTNIDIDDALMGRVLKESRLPTKKSAVEAGLKLLLQVGLQKKIRAFRGKLKWEGNLADMRTA